MRRAKMTLQFDVPDSTDMAALRSSLVRIARSTASIRAAEYETAPVLVWTVSVSEWDDAIIALGGDQ